MALKELGSLLIQNSQLWGIPPPHRQLGCKDSTGGKGSQVNKSISAQPCLPALLLCTNSLLCQGSSQDQGALSREKPPGCTFSLAKAVLEVCGRGTEGTGSLGRGRPWAGPVFPVETGAEVLERALLSAGCMEGRLRGDLGEREKFTGRKGKEREGPEGRAGTWLSQSVPNAIFPIPTCRGA